MAHHAAIASPPSQLVALHIDGSTLRILAQLLRSQRTVIFLALFLFFLACAGTNGSKGKGTMPAERPWASMNVVRDGETFWVLPLHA